MKEYCQDPARKSPGGFKDFDVRNVPVPEMQNVTNQWAQPATHTLSICPELSLTPILYVSAIPFGVDCFLIPRDNAYGALMRLRYEQRKKNTGRQDSLEETYLQMNYIPHVSPQRCNALEESLKSQLSMVNQCHLGGARKRRQHHSLE